MISSDAHLIEIDAFVRFMVSFIIRAELFTLVATRLAGMGCTISCTNHLTRTLGRLDSHCVCGVGKHDFG